MTLSVDTDLNTMKKPTKIPVGKPESYQVASGIPLTTSLLLVEPNFLERSNIL